MQDVTLGSIAEVFGGFPPRGHRGLSQSENRQFFASAAGLRALSARGDIDVNKLEQIRLPKGTDLARRQIQPDDILLASRGSLAKSALVRQDIPRNTYASANLIVIRPDRTRVIANYVFAWLDNFTRRWADRFQRSSTGQLNVRLSDIESLEVPLPPRHEQERIANIAEALRTSRDLQRQVADQADVLLASFLKDAFANT